MFILFSMSAHVICVCEFCSTEIERNQLFQYDNMKKIFNNNTRPKNTEYIVLYKQVQCGRLVAADGRSDVDNNNTQSSYYYIGTYSSTRLVTPRGSGVLNFTIIIIRRPPDRSFRMICHISAILLCSLYTAT